LLVANIHIGKNVSRFEKLGGPVYESFFAWYCKFSPIFKILDWFSLRNVLMLQNSSKLVNSTLRHCNTEVIQLTLLPIFKMAILLEQSNNVYIINPQHFDLLWSCRVEWKDMALRGCLHRMVHLCHIAVSVLLVKEMLLEGYVI
jgi:hypothetical protein